MARPELAVGHGDHENWHYSWMQPAAKACTCFPGADNPGFCLHWLTGETRRKINTTIQIILTHHREQNSETDKMDPLVRISHTTLMRETYHQKVVGFTCILGLFSALSYPGSSLSWYYHQMCNGYIQYNNSLSVHSNASMHSNASKW